MLLFGIRLECLSLSDYVFKNKLPEKNLKAYHL